MTSIEIKSAKDGPNLILIDGQVKGAFCRCGHSNSKPMCDGTHRKVEFKADEKVTTIR